MQVGTADSFTNEKRPETDTEILGATAMTFLIGIIMRSPRASGWRRHRMRQEARPAGTRERLGRCQARAQIG